MPPFKVQWIDHVVLRVAELERSMAFYQAILGCQVVRDRPDLGLVHLRAGTSMIDLISIDGKLGSRGGPAAGELARNVDHLCLRVEPFEERELVAHLAQHGVVPDGPASDNFGAEGTGPSLYFSDPDGNSIELKGPARAVASENMTLLEALLEAFNRHDLDRIMGLFAEQCSLDMPRGKQPWGTRYVGKAAVRRGLQSRFEMLPDVQYRDARHFATEQMGISEWLLTGTLRSGETLELRGCDHYEFRDGQVIRKDSYWKIVD